MCKTLSVNDFVRLGYLQELNRLFLHPLGLDLQVKLENNTLEFSEIIDCRDNENGIIFNEGYLDIIKRENIEFEYNKKMLYRLKNLGYVIQEIHKEEE